MSILGRVSWLLAAAITSLSMTAAPAPAAFTAFLSMGETPVLPGISCAPYDVGGAVCATVGPDAKLRVNRYDGSAWSGWDTAGGPTRSKPSCASIAARRVLCATQHTSGAVAITVYNGVSWSGQRLFGEGLASPPSCSGYMFSAALCVARNQTGGLIWFTTTGTETSAFSSLPGAVTYPPNCASDRTGYSPRNVICAYGNQDGHVYARRFDGTTATAAVDLGGLTGREVLCTNLGPGVVGKVTCAATDPSSTTFIDTFNGGTFTAANWTGFSSAGGLSSSTVSCGATAANTIACGSIAVTNASLYVIQTGGSYQLIGGAFQGDPSCFTLSAGKIMCAMVGIDGIAKSTVGP